MKQLLLLSFAVSGIFIQLSAQTPTLTSDNSSPKPGDNYTTQTAAVTGIALFSGGANQNWNYSNLIDSGNAIAFQAVLPSSTPYADSFPGSNVSVKTVADSVFSYFTSSSSSLVLNGVATFNGSVIRYNPYRTYLTYPFTYNSFVTQAVSVEIPGFGSAFTGKDSITGDGYGSLSIPGRSFSNVLRVQYIENLTGSLDSGFFKIITNIRTVSYLYLSPDTHVPVLSDVQTKTTVTTSIFGTSLVTTNESRAIDYLKSFVLPVTFQSFKATLQNKEIALQWNTAQETNTDHFTVQRSLTGHDFQSIASVQAKGNTKGASYNFTDNSFANGSVPVTVYYRIQSSDKDGKLLLSHVAVVRGSDAVVVNVYPNPASNFIRISGKESAIADAILIYDAKGSVVQQLRNYSISQPINIAGLSKGSYVVKVIIGNKTTSVTVIKQ